MRTIQIMFSIKPIPSISFFLSLILNSNFFGQYSYLIKPIIKININLMASKELGSKVLTKIQNLISEIDRTHQSNSKRNRVAQNLHLLQGRQDKEKIYKKMSNAYIKHKDKIQSKLKDEVYQDAKQFDKFKVTNKTTLKILQQRSIKPIQERIGAIMAKKDQNINQLRNILNKRQLQHLQPFHRSIDMITTSRKYTQSDLQDFRADLDYKNKERIKKRNFNKLYHLVRPDQPKIPIVNELSRSLSVNRNLKKNYSENVFKRMSQYGFDIVDKKREMMKERKIEEGNFQPRLCKKSIQIIESKRQSGHEPHLINMHCLCKIDRQSMKLAEYHIDKKKSIQKRISPTIKVLPVIKGKQQINKKEQNENTPIRSKNKDNKHDKSLSKKPSPNSSTIKSITPLKQKQTNTIKSRTPLKTPERKSQKMSSQPSFVQKTKQNSRK